METRTPIRLKKLQLIKSEPGLYNRKLYQHSLDKKDDFSSQNLIKSDVQPHPPIACKPNITIVSPKRRIRVPLSSVSSVSMFERNSESSQHSNDEGFESIISKRRTSFDGGSSACSEKSVDVDKCFDEEYSGDSDIGNDDCITDADESNFDSDDDYNLWETVSPFSDAVSVSSHTTDNTFSPIESSDSLQSQLSRCSLNNYPYPILKSLFSNKPPTLYFTVEGEPITPLPSEVQRILKWKHSSVTPKVVKSCLISTGFRITKKNSDWLGVWGKHMKSLSFKSVKEHQKVNHFPGSFYIGRKDKLWRGFSKMRILHGKNNFDFLPQTYILPHDIDNLNKIWDEKSGKQKWIVKPPASARGSGIKVISKWRQIPRKRPCVIQKYLAKPYLIGGRKFDLRIYVFVSSFDPLRIYIFQDGLVRFATSKYSTSSKHLSNKYIHLTNYSINKTNSNISDSVDEDGQLSYKWSIKHLWSYFNKLKINTKKLWDTIKDISVKAVLCAESAVNTNLKQNVKSRYSCYELFGLDILLDHNLKPWLLEVNISPSLHSNSELDKNIKGQLVKDVLNISGFLLPKTISSHSSRINKLGDFTADHFWFKQRNLLSNEKAKHTYYLQRHKDLSFRTTILDVVTPDDLLMLMETEDELSRCGEFERLFPTAANTSYLHFLGTPRYYNMLLDEWTKQYTPETVKHTLGVRFLQSLSERRIHLQSGANVHSAHQWYPHPTTNPKSRHSSSQSSRISSRASRASFPNIRRQKSEIAYSLVGRHSKEKTPNSLSCKFPLKTRTSSRKGEMKT